MKLYSGQNEKVRQWLGKRLEYNLAPSTHLVWVAGGPTGPIYGAMGFGGLMGSTFGSMSIAVERPRAALPLVRASCHQIFGAFGARAIYLNVSAKRTEWLASLIRTVGCVEIDRVPDGLKPGEDLVTLKLTPETCRPWRAELAKMARTSVREVA